MDHYHMLDINRAASKDDVRAAYKKKALQLHPDKNPNGEALFKLVQCAYATLMDTTKRTVYDRELDLKQERRPYGAPAPPRRQHQGGARSGTANPRHAGTKSTPRASKETNENLFMDKGSTNAGYTDQTRAEKDATEQPAGSTGFGATPRKPNTSAPPPNRTYYEECGGNFNEWFKKKQEEFRETEEHTRSKAESAKKLEQEEREKAEAWRRMQRDRERERESELEREKERRRRENEIQRREQEANLREERQHLVREFTRQQETQHAELQKHLAELEKERSDLREEKTRLARDKREAARDAIANESSRRMKQHAREADLVAEQAAAEARLKAVHEQQKYLALERARSEKEREQQQMRDDARASEERAASRREEERAQAKIASENAERKVQQDKMAVKRAQMMEGIKEERKRHEEEVAAMRRETDKIEGEMRAKLEALRAAKREGRQIDLEEFKL